MQSFDRMMGRGVIDDQFYDELEQALLEADTNVTTVGQILEELRKAVREEKITEPGAMKARLQKAIADRFKLGWVTAHGRRFPRMAYLTESQLANGSSRNAADSLF